MTRHPLTSLAATLAGSLLVATTAATVPAPATDAAPSETGAPAATTRAAPGTGLRPFVTVVGRVPVARINGAPSAPPASACHDLDSNCYTPQQLRVAYGVKELIDGAHIGKGQTIVVIDAFGSPTIGADLRTFDHAYDLVGPPSLKVITPIGSVPFDPNDPAESGWAIETTLDVEWAHAMAPGAGIDLLTSPVDETEGTAGLGDFLDLETYAVDHRLGQVITQSWGATENTLETEQGRSLVAGFEHLYHQAAADHITVLASTGDTGSQNPADASDSRTYAFPTVNFPASSPLVTAVGGTTLQAATNGTWQSERVWNDDSGAGGGGVSRLFGEPSFQEQLPAATQKELGDHRGLPDVAWDADPSTGVLIYGTYDGGGAPGFELVGGTSDASPQWAGLVADVDQARGNPIGALDADLYRLGAAGGDFHDIVTGTNAFGGVRGYDAGVGWDAASGWGTPLRGELAPALVKAPAGT